MTDTTNGWPGKPGVPLNPEKDGWHWVRRIDEKQAHIQRWIGGQFWLSPSFGGPKTDMANYEYLGPVLSHDEATALQKRVAELEGVLRPFAGVGEFIAKHHPDPETDQNHETATLVRHFRNAYIALEGKKDE